ncbi:MAG TPA: TonB-dependent receptor [Bryobacteraceae bacterium]|nr:TonB-dependent receptor [Bryobacteraceae bacterium]
MIFRTRCIVTIFLSACVLLVTPCAAQLATAELTGTVTDQSGADVPNAKVTVTKIDTGLSRSVVTDGSGNYKFTLLDPGVYNLSAAAQGFKKTIQSNFELQINQSAEMNLKLALGNVSETVEVNAAPPLLETQSSSIGTVIDTKLVSNLPLNGRNFVQLATLTPGVNGTGYSVAGTIMSGTRPDDKRPGTELFSNGNREGSNDFLYDGADDNERLTLSITLRPPVEAIKEFKVQTNLFSADVGRNSGAIVDVISKSGTNQFHGSAFEFLRNSYMDARSFFNAKGTPFPSFKYNQFGGSFGGPIIHNKTFFFVDYEGYRRSSLNTQVVTVPTAAERRGDFTGLSKIYDPLTTVLDPATGRYVRQQFSGNIIPAARFDPLTAILVNAYPLPQTSGAINNYTSNTTQSQNWDQGDVRIDQQITSNDSFFARWSVQHTTTIVPNTYPATTLPGISQPISLGNEDSFAGTSFTPDQQAVATYIHIFSPRLVNELRAGFNRFKLDYSQQGVTPGSDFGNKFGIPNSNGAPQQSGFPIVSPANYGGIGQSRSLPIFRTENTYQGVDNVTYTLNRHTLKFGEDFRRRQLSEYQTNQGNGRFNFAPTFTDQPGVNGTGDSIASMLLGYPSLTQQDFELAFPGLRGIENGLYIADDWRVNDKLTLNIGLRWDYYSPYSEVANRIANFDPATATMQVAGQNGVSSTAGVQSDWKDFGPRFGFAYQAATHTVIRGGFGLFYNPNGNGGTYLRGERTLPFGPVYLQSPSDTFVTGPGAPTTFSQGFPAPPVINLAAAANPSGALLGTINSFKAAYAEQMNFTIEQEITPIQGMLRMGYVGNLGRRLDTTFNINQPVPGPGATGPRRPYYSINPKITDVTFDVSDGDSNYHAFQVSFDKRLVHGLTALAGYTWAHSIDNVGTVFGGGTGTPQDPRCRSCDRGNSAFDIRHRFTASFTYQIPGFRNKGITGILLGNWQTNGLVQVQTGLPFTPQLNSTTVNTGTASRPNCLAGPVPPFHQSLREWFNPAQFVTPPLYTYGNCGRDILYGPGRWNWDQSVFKNFPVTERVNLELRFEAFNVFNHPQFGQPNATIGSSQAGIINSIVGNPRDLQIAAHLTF